MKKCVNTFVARHKHIITLDKIQMDNPFDTKHRADATGLLSSINTKQFIATMYLFQEIFVVPRPLSRYLQTVNIDICNALAMMQSAINSFEKMRNSARVSYGRLWCHRIENQSYSSPQRQERDLAIHAEECFEVETPEFVWIRSNFYVVVNTLLGP